MQLKEEHMEVNVSSTKLPPTSSSDEPGPSNRGQHMGLGQLTERKIFHQGKKLPMANDLSDPLCLRTMINTFSTE